MEGIIEKLKEIYNDNPDLQSLFKRKFPNLFIDTHPIAHRGTIFLRKAFPGVVYSVAYAESTSKFFIRNVSEDSTWVGVLEPSNGSKNDTHPYLNERDFDILLKQSGVSLGSIYILRQSVLQDLHHKLIE